MKNCHFLLNCCKKFRNYNHSEFLVFEKFYRMRFLSSELFEVVYIRDFYFVTQVRNVFPFLGSVKANTPTSYHICLLAFPRC